MISIINLIINRLLNNTERPEKDYRTKKPRVYIVESEPKLNKVNAKILEKYLSIIISDIDFSQNVKEQINKKIKENENFKKISNE